MILLDTHVLLWLDCDAPQLGAQTRDQIRDFWGRHQVAVSAISFWEVAMLQERGRISLAVPALVWRDDWLKAGLTELPLDGRVAVQAAELKPFHPDPADRFICATAQARGLALATADRAILDWTASLPRLNARH